MEVFIVDALTGPGLTATSFQSQPAQAEGSSFRSQLAKGFRVAAGVASAAGTLIPGAGLISLALGGISKLIGGQGAAQPSGTAPEIQSLLENGRGMNLRYLALQEKMATEARVFTALSNMMRVRHDAAQNAISNIR